MPKEVTNSFDDEFKLLTQTKIENDESIDSDLYDESCIINNSNYIFYSDNEDNKNRSNSILKKSVVDINNIYKITAYFNEEYIKTNKMLLYIKSRINLIKNKESKINSINNNIANIKIKNNLSKLNDNSIIKNTKNIIKTNITNKKYNNMYLSFIKDINFDYNNESIINIILNSQSNFYLKTNIKNLIHNKKSLEIKQYENLNNLNYNKNKYFNVNSITKNTLLVQNIYFQLQYGTEKYFPSFIFSNILNSINYKTNKHLNIKYYYDLYCQFKVILKLCIGLNKSIDYLNEGIGLNSFHALIPEVWNEKRSFAKSIFDIFNKSKTGFLSFNEFMQGMFKLRSKRSEDKIDIFMKIIDINKNGILRYKDIEELSYYSINRILRSYSIEEQYKQFLSTAFADLIYKYIDVNLEKSNNIRISDIREKILLGGPEAEYLELLCFATE